MEKLINFKSKYVSVVLEKLLKDKTNDNSSAKYFFIITTSSFLSTFFVLFKSFTQYTFNSYSLAESCFFTVFFKLLIYFTLNFDVQSFPVFDVPGYRSTEKQSIIEEKIRDIDPLSDADQCLD